MSGGSVYNYYRDYDPTTGRYVESDPIGLKAGVNTYTYIASAPLMFSDPWGLEKQVIFFDDPLVTTSNATFPTPVYVYNTESGKWVGPFSGNSAPTQSSTLCNNQCPKVQGGNYSYQANLFPFTLQRKGQTRYLALNVGTVTAVAPNPTQNKNQSIITGVWVHQGGAQTTNSKGCLTISPEDWANFISNFGFGDTGTLKVLPAN